MKVLVPVWGEVFTDYLKRGLLRSLSWPLNEVALKGSEWVFANEQNFRDTFLNTIESCIKENQLMFIACPDFIFADGSIQTMMDFAASPGACVGMVHVRVLPSILDDLDKPQTSSMLVTKAFQHLHKSWSEADCTKPKSNCYAGGVSWRRQNNVFLVQHRLPSAFIVNFIPSDLEYFKAERFDSWDHRWPSTWEHRQRLIGSSDGAFMAEVTEDWGHIPNIRDTNPLEQDAFHGERIHNKVNRQFISVLRGI